MFSHVLTKAKFGSVGGGGGMCPLYPSGHVYISKIGAGSTSPFLEFQLDRYLGQTLLHLMPFLFSVNSDPLSFISSPKPFAPSIPVIVTGVLVLWI